MKNKKNQNMRVRSWLRMNAGGVLNTCKSNGVVSPFKPESLLEGANTEAT